MGVDKKSVLQLIAAAKSVLVMESSSMSNGLRWRLGNLKNAVNAVENKTKGKSK